MSEFIKTYKKTAPTHAALWDGSVSRTQEIIDWAAGHGVVIELVREYNPLVSKLLIPTLEGPIFASVGDFVAKGVNNEFWPIKPDIMQKSYQEA